MVKCLTNGQIQIFDHLVLAPFSAQVAAAGADNLHRLAQAHIILLSLHHYCCCCCTCYHGITAAAAAAAALLLMLLLLLLPPLLLLLPLLPPLAVIAVIAVFIRRMGERGPMAAPADGL